MPTTVNFVINTSLIFEHDTSCCLPLILKIIFSSLKTFVCLEKRDDDNMTECSFSVWVFYIYYNIFGMENSSCIHIWLPIAIRKENKKDMKLDSWQYLDIQSARKKMRPMGKKQHLAKRCRENISQKKKKTGFSFVAAVHSELMSPTA